MAAKEVNIYVPILPATCTMNNVNTERNIKVFHDTHSYVLRTVLYSRSFVKNELNSDQYQYSCFIIIDKEQRSYEKLNYFSAYHKYSHSNPTKC